MRRLRPFLGPVVLSLTLVASGCSLSDLPTSPSSSAAAKGGQPGGGGSGHDPILFVHGYNASASTWTTMVRNFKRDGWTSAELFTWSYNYRQSNATTAAQLEAKVDSILAQTGKTRVDVISHSMGALSARYYVKHLSGDGKIDAWVSLGGPNHGTQWAAGCFDTSCVEMRPNSTFLDDLNATDETPGTPRYATWWSPCDEVIQPNGSVLLSGAVNTETGCISHSQLHEDTGVYRQVRDWVK